MTRWSIVLKPPPGLVGGALSDAGHVEKTIALGRRGKPRWQRQKRSLMSGSVWDEMRADQLLESSGVVGSSTIDEPE